ncbi:MAG: DNA-binding response regulator, partial [Terriglobia bacterium]
VCLISHHPLVLDEFRRLLAGTAFRVQAQRLESTLAPELRHLRMPNASIYVVDAFAPKLATEALVASVLERFPRARLLVLAERFTEGNCYPLLRLGAKGLLNYTEAREQLPRALEAVARGGFWVPRSLLSRFVDSVLTELRGRRVLDAPVDLSRREREVLDALLENDSNKEIANKLHISERTAKFHVSNLLAKFGVQRRADLILLCYQHRPSAS